MKKGASINKHNICIDTGSCHSHIPCVIQHVGTLHASKDETSSTTRPGLDVTKTMNLTPDTRCRKLKYIKQYNHRSSYSSTSTTTTCLIRHYADTSSSTVRPNRSDGCFPIKT
mmetsp:Transcript_17997/g.26753  ORF Transcript_17997/g.26753 Transcript_17997/m.26753 type:complete len:113 (+) Transcript_17997:122-460(+)